MAFLKNSRYYGLPTTEVKTRSGRQVTVAKLRALPAASGSVRVVSENDRLDLLALSRYKDPTRFWRIADANTELDATELNVTGRAIEVPDTE